MANQSDSYVRRVATAFLITGRASLWGQLVLAIISTIVLLFTSFRFTTDVAANNPGRGGGIFLATTGLIALYIGAYWAFSYTRLAKRLQSKDTRLRPKPKDATQSLRIGLIINLVGMLLTLLGAEATIGLLVAKSLQTQGTVVFTGQVSQFIQPIDIFIVQANINIVLAHFVGVVASLWLIRCMNRQ